MIADFVLDMSNHLKELGGVNLRISENISQGVGKCGLEFDKRLKSHFVDALIAVAIKIREILGFKFFN